MITVNSTIIDVLQDIIPVYTQPLHDIAVNSTIIDVLQNIPVYIQSLHDNSEQYYYWCSSEHPCLHSALTW